MSGESWVAGKRPDTATSGITSDPHVEYLLRVADDRLVLGHRLSEWCGHAPILEEDIARVLQGVFGVDGMNASRVLVRRAFTFLRENFPERPLRIGTRLAPVVRRHR